MNTFLLFVCIAMTAVALWRLPAVRYGDPLRRTLWGCSAGFAVALWSRFPPVRHGIDSLGITDLSGLVKDLSAMAAALALLSYAVTSYGVSQDAPPRHIEICRRVARISRRATVVVIPLMLILFGIVIDRSVPSRDFTADHAGQWGACLFATCYYLYLGSSGATCAYQWGHVSRRAESAVLRISLALGAAACWLFAAYSVIRVTFMWGAMVIPASPGRTHLVVSLSDLLNMLGALLFMCGASLPTTGVAVERWKIRRTLWRLHPLSRDLAHQFPGLWFQPPASRLREAVRHAPAVDVRLDRTIQAIGDAVEQLRHHVVPELWPVVAQSTADHPDHEAAAEAYWIAAALRSAGEGRRSQRPAPALPSKPYSDSIGEGRWLVRVQDVYARVTPASVDEMLDRAGRPPMAAREHEVPEGPVPVRTS
ncbi:MAB_1171c family putative transporter [Streptomyces sp. CT34]|uniref:MAB_1171c family putative transporter n=1 Tax=Streptomyces sp. CT34 TaxID=1553907 RepID=UPI000AC95B85|nr:MAB_1171c family putative transporter [Streptomyces sp. CT34]